MEILKNADALKKISIYLKQENFMLPYFIIANGAVEAESLNKELPQYLPRLYLSNFLNEDQFLDIDIFIEKIAAFFTDAIIFGVGEYVHFTGQVHLLQILKDMHFQHKIIFFCRGATNMLENLALSDLKFFNLQICRIFGQDLFSVTQYNPALNIQTDANGFSEFMKLIERGQNAVSLKSKLQLQNVNTINSFYDAVKKREPHLSISSIALNENQWQNYFLDNRCENFSPDHWRTFAAGFQRKFDNPYLQLVFNISENYNEYMKNLFAAILTLDSKNIAQFYSLRKKILKNIRSPYFYQFLEKLKNLPADSVMKYLTDNTREERHLMIKAVQGREKIPAVFKKNYSAMNDYLNDFDFEDDDISFYFQKYKLIKICNIDDEHFPNMVQAFSSRRLYNHFETRQKILEKISPASKIYWLDALGVEFVSYIKAQARRLGLFLKIEIARAGLPTLTSFNKNFYENWAGEKFPKNGKLDELKHAQEKFDMTGKCSPPFYIDDEFAIIDETLNEIHIALKKNPQTSIILTSDHGSSRPAVMYRFLNKYTLHSVGEHSGRCCLISELDEKPNCATSENGYWVLTNYDRFTGGRISSVEVHGGATLEEVLVPVIEFSLI